MTKAGLEPGQDVTLVQQQFDMQALLKGDIDAAQAMIYNEYAQVLEAKNPTTGKLYQPTDFNVINWNDDGTAMLQDAIWANTDEAGATRPTRTTTVKFLAASLKGWIYCRDNADEVPRHRREGRVEARREPPAVADERGQQADLAFAVGGLGAIDQAAWEQTVKIARTTNADGQTVLTKAPDDAAYTNDYVTKAIEQLKGQGVDVMGANYKPETVTLKADGA